MLEIKITRGTAKHSWQWQIIYYYHDKWQYKTIQITMNNNDGGYTQYITITKNNKLNMSTKNKDSAQYNELQWSMNNNSNEQ